MAMSDEARLETLRAEYESTAAELNRQRQTLKHAKHVVADAGSALIQAMIEAGLTQYGPVASHTEWHAPSETFRRVWVLPFEMPAIQGGSYEIDDR